MAARWKGSRSGALSGRLSLASGGRAGFQPCRKAMRAKRVPMRSFTRGKFFLFATPKLGTKGRKIC